MTTYVTTSMDTWDIISKKVYGDEHFIDALIAANLEHRKVVFFSAGVELNVSVVEDSKLAEPNLPSWKRGRGND